MAWHVALAERCDTCRTLFSKGDQVFDAYVPTYGVWATICRPCFTDLGCSLGTGRGQQWTHGNTEKKVAG